MAAPAELGIRHDAPEHFLTLWAKALRTEAESQERVDAVFDALGVAGTLSPDIKFRFCLLDRVTETLADGAQAAGYASRVAKQAEIEGHAWSPTEIETVIRGSVFADLGKSGHLGATREQMALIVSVYAQENITADELLGTVRNFFETYCKSGGREEQLTVFRSLRLDPDNMTMREFYNLHTAWGFDILVNSGLPQETVAAAVSHHRWRKDNPDNPRGILNENDTYCFAFGTTTEYGRAEIAVGMLDFYDALLRRGGFSHEEGIKEMRATIHRGRYAQDQRFTEIIGDMDIALGPQYRN